MERIKAWWWIATHPLKSIAIRRWVKAGGVPTPYEPKENA